MKPIDFYLFIEGYNKRILDQHEIARRQSYFTVATQLTKPMDMGTFFKQYWPLPGDGEGQKSKQERLLEKLKRVKENGKRAT